MLPSNAKAFYEQPGLRVAATVAGSFIMLLLLLAILRPEMMGMAMLHLLMSAAGL